MKRLLLVVAAATCALAGPARADLSDSPVRVRMERPERLAEPGREFTAMITIEAARDTRLADIELGGDGWTGVRLDAPRELALAAGTTGRFAIAATSSAGCGPLVLRGTADGRPWRQSFTPTREAWDGLLPVDSDKLPPALIRTAGGEKIAAPAGLTMAQLTALAADDLPPPPDKNGPTCTVTGRLGYWHSRVAAWAPAFGSHVWARVFPPGGMFYTVPGVELTNDGYFSLDVPTGMSVMIGFGASSRAVVVQEDGLWEDNHVWYTAPFTIPAGQSTYEVGAIHPNSHHGALNICTVITHAHDHFRDLGWDVSKIDLQWPDSDGSFFSSSFVELHLEREDAWSEATICHEWGHYWHYEYAHRVTHDYCNGVCDDGDDCGHCQWCPEEDRVAWKEGSAQILSRLLTDHLATRLSFAPSHMGLDAPYDDPGCAWQPWGIENVVAGAIYDMADDDTDIEHHSLNTDYLGQPVYDRLDLTTDDILHIMADHCAVEGHEPYRMPAFFRCAAAYVAALGQPEAMRARLWETAWNWDLQLDTQGPLTVVNLTSTFPVGTGTATAVGGFYWQQASDDLSGACAYSVRLNQNSPLAPDNVHETTRLQWWPDNALTPGTWYFTVKAVDRAGNWASSYATYGPVIITAPGPADLTPVTPAGWSSPLVVRSTTAPEAPNPVTQPNHVQGHTVYFNWGEKNEGTGPTALFRNCLFLDGNLVRTSGSRLLGAGVSNETRNEGPVNVNAFGRHTVWIRLDGLDSTPEPNENNNYRAMQVVFSPLDIALGQTIVRSGGLPDATAGHSRLPFGTMAFPNGDGFDIELCLYPELVWAVPNVADDRLEMRLYPRDVGQTGFATPLATSASLADRPAAIVLNTFETLMNSYCIGVSDQQGSGGTYRIHRELGRMFAMPDTLAGAFDATNCLDMYYTYNELQSAAWFTIKLANPSTSALVMRYFQPDFTMGSLGAADLTLAAAAGDTIHHSVRLEPGELALTVVTRDPRRTTAAAYSVYAYQEKPDLQAGTPTGWFANLVPHVGLPHNATSGSVPAPTRLVGDADSTGIYWSLRNTAGNAPAGAGVRRAVYVDGTTSSSSIFIEPITAGQEVRATVSRLQNIRGGRHTLYHRVNTTRAIDEDDWTDNDYGRQWVWSPRVLAASQSHTLPLPADAWGGLGYVKEGLVAPNCDGFRVTTTSSTILPVMFTAWAAASYGDVDLGLYSGSGLQDGFTGTDAMSAWSGSGCDFVLRCTTTVGTFHHLLGLSRPSALASGDVALRAQASSVLWMSPVGGTRTGTVETGTYFDTMWFSLPSGVYRFALESDAVPLGFSLHDVTGGYGEKTSPWQEGLAWQQPNTAGTDVSFTISVPNPAPTRFALVVWRPDRANENLDAPWTVTVSGNISAVEETPSVPVVMASRLVAAAPNPFNPQTTIGYEVARPGDGALTVHDVRGRLVRTLVAGDLATGRHEVRWDGLDDTGQRVPSGIYVARLRAAGSEVDLLKLTLVK
jgi:hypothetical protein